MNSPGSRLYDVVPFDDDDRADLSNVRKVNGRTVGDRVRGDGTAESVVLLSDEEAAELAQLSKEERAERFAHLYSENS